MNMKELTKVSKFLQELKLGSGLKLDADTNTVSVPTMVGATESTSGVAGLVPPATPEEAEKVLLGNGTWVQAVEVDGVTTSFDTSGKIKAQDVAIGGDASDLASARGQIGNSKTQGSHDFSSGMLSEKPGMYTAIKSGSTNVPFTGPFAEMILGTPTYRGSLLITSGRPSLPRAAVSAIDTEQGFSGYNRLITEQQVGDGLTVNNGIISVPEYDGATASSAGTSGLVPPATSAQQDAVLHGSGEWKSATQSPSETTSGWVNYEPVYTNGQNAHAAPSEGWVQVVAEAKGAATPYLSLCSYKSTTPDSVITDASSDKWDYELLSESTHILSNRGRLNLRVAKGTKFNLWFTDEANITIKMYRFIPCKSSV